MKMCVCTVDIFLFFVCVFFGEIASREFSKII